MATSVSGLYGFTQSVTPTVPQLTAWVNAIIDTLTAVGLVQTTDTGQLNPLSLPAWPSSTWGYLMFRFSDAAQATAPVFMKVSLGRSGTNIAGRSYTIQFGTATNGAGTLSGTVSSAYVTTPGNNPQTVTQLQIYACFTTDGALFIGFDYGDLNSSYTIETFAMGISAERTRLANGTFDEAGLSIMYKLLSTTYWRAQSMRWASPAALYLVNNDYCLVPGLPANTARSNGDKQLYPHWYNLPDIRQRWSSFSVRSSEFTAMPTTFSATPFGATARTFLSPGTIYDNAFMVANASDSSVFTPCFLWE